LDAPPGGRDAKKLSAMGALPGIREQGFEGIVGSGVIAPTDRASGRLRGRKCAFSKGAIL
jgi:hypothetical protein